MNLASRVRTRLRLRVKMIVTKNGEVHDATVTFRIGPFASEAAGRIWEEAFLSARHTAEDPPTILFEIEPAEFDTVVSPDASENWDFTPTRSSWEQLAQDLHYEVQSRWNEHFNEAL